MAVVSFATSPISTQLVLSEEYCQVPEVASVLPIIAIPEILLSLSGSLANRPKELMREPLLLV